MSISGSSNNNRRRSNSGRRNSADATNNCSHTANVSERHGGNHSNSNTRHRSSDIDKNDARNAATIDLVAAVAIILLSISRNSSSSICDSSVVGATAMAESSLSYSSRMLLA